MFYRLGKKSCRGGGGGGGPPPPPLVRPRVNKQQVTVVVLPAFCAAHPKNENIQYNDNE